MYNLLHFIEFYPMPELNSEKPANFITHIIDDDLKNNKHPAVYTRFPPEPNGYLHIGHAKSICLNFSLAQDYKGQCNLRFDDTNPASEEAEYVKIIKYDIAWLGFSWAKECYSSDYFEQFYQYARELIQKGLAYVCFLDPEQTRSYRGTLTQAGKNSPYRHTSATQNLALFAQMKAGKFAEGQCVLRAKIDMASAFMCLRDPTLYRIRFQSHHQTSNTWCIYPMYDFAHPISDAIEGITHSLCTLEFADNRHLYDWILEHLGDFNHSARPHQYEFSRLNLEYTVMSKRQLQQLVKQNLVSGWDDPRMPTIAGLRRRGYTPTAIINFAHRVGISRVDSLTDIGVLETCIREDLNTKARRAMAVIDPVKLIIKNYPKNKLESLNAPCHPQNEAMGQRKIFFSAQLYIDKADFAEVVPNKKYKRLCPNKEVRLRNAYIIKATTFDKDEAGNIKTIYATYNKDTLGKNPPNAPKIKGVIHFVEATTALAATFMLYDRLLKFPSTKMTKTTDFSDAINTNSLVVKAGFVEASMKNAPSQKGYQFEREGYFCRDNQGGEKLVFNKIVALRDVWQNKVLS